MLKAKDIMTKKVITLSPNATLVEASKLFIANGITGIPIVDTEEKVIGIITEKDILNFALTYSSNLKTTKIQEAMTKNVVCFTSDTGLDKIAECFSKSEIRRVPIVDEGRLVGIISRKDLISSLISHDYKL